MSIHLQPPVPLVTLVKTEPPTVIKNEPPEEALEEEISTDTKDINIVYHPLSEDFIKSETVLEDILENKHLECVQTQAIVKAENSPFIKTENIIQRNKSEDTSDGNVSRITDQGVVEVQASNEHSNALSNLETNEQSVLNFSKNLNGISARSGNCKSSKKTDFVECYKTVDTTLWKKEKEKIKVIKAPVIPVEAHEYTSLADDRHVCNHCQSACSRLGNVKVHIKKMHREVTTMYQCPYCSYKSKWGIRNHIIQNHIDTKDIQWFQHHCDKCAYKTCRFEHLKSHKLIHLQPEEIQYFYCYHCSYKSKHKMDLKNHIFRQHFKNVKKGKIYDCNKCDYKTYTSTKLKNHKLIHLKPEEILYFYCYHCSYRAKRKDNLKKHIFRHFEKEQVEFYCYICNFMTSRRESIIKHIKKHSKVQNKSENNEGS